MLTYADICCYLLTYADLSYSGFFTSLRIPSAVTPDDAGAVMLNATGLLSPLTHARLCSRMLTYAEWHRRMLTYAHLGSRMLTHADVC